MSREQYIKVVMCGVQCWCQHQNYRHRANGVGQKHLKGTMNHSGHAYQMQANPVMNWSLANARRVVLGSASAKKVSYSAQPSVSVKVSVSSLPCDP